MNGYAPRRVKRLPEPPKPATDRTRLADAFRALRKRGFVTDMDYACCRSCAIDGICAHIYDIIDHGAELPIGQVYWHAQDDEIAFDGGDDLVGVLMIRHGFETDDFASDDASTIWIVHELEAAGFAVEWDGDMSRCIEVRAAHG